MSLDYRTKKYAWTPLTYTPSANGDHRITIGPAEGQYVGQPEKRVYRIRIHGVTEPKQVTIGNSTLNKIRPKSAVQGWSWSSCERVLEITMPQPVAVRESVTVTVVQASTFRDQLIAARAGVSGTTASRQKHPKPAVGLALGTVVHQERTPYVAGHQSGRTDVE